jgi:hypothetical protein
MAMDFLEAALLQRGWRETTNYDMLQRQRARACETELDLYSPRIFGLFWSSGDTLASFRHI